MNKVSAARAIGAVLLLVVSCSGGRSEPARIESAGLALEVRTVPEHPRVGGNQLELLLRDAHGAPVDDAHVSVRVHMHAMGSMPAMGGAAGVEKTGDGRWRADFDLAMGGTWVVEVQAHRPDGGMLGAEGSLTVGAPGLRLAATGDMEPAPAAAKPETTGAPEGGGAPGGTAAAPGAFRFDESRLRQIGVHSELPRTEDLARVVRALGRVVLDETTLHDVTIRVAGFVEEIDADALGEPVVAGQVLFRFYSPDAHAAQSEYLTMRRSQAAARGGSAPERSDGLVRAAAERLRLWGIDAADVAALARRGAPQETLPVRAPISGYVVEKTIVAGSPVAVGQRAYRIAPLDRVWIEAEVYEAEPPARRRRAIRRGGPALRRRSALPGHDRLRLPGARPGAAHRARPSRTRQPGSGAAPRDVCGRLPAASSRIPFHRAGERAAAYRRSQLRVRRPRRRTAPAAAGRDRHRERRTRRDPVRAHARSTRGRVGHVPRGQ
ncbi:MAG: efflux RND transporter periplasmic adaptor subunit [Myxococcota bacterium]|nr:efflux RND transporter periplasmic adaptor subunit [Myxococcota bacterium]